MTWAVLPVPILALLLLAGVGDSALGEPGHADGGGRTGPPARPDGRPTPPESADSTATAAYEIERNGLLVRAGWLWLQMRLAGGAGPGDLGAEYDAVRGQLADLGVGPAVGDFDHLGEYARALERFEERGHPPLTTGAAQTGPTPATGWPHPSTYSGGTWTMCMPSFWES